MSTLSFSIQLITKFMMCVSLAPTTNSKWGSLKFIKMSNRIWFSHQNEYQMNIKWNSLDYFSQNNCLPKSVRYYNNRLFFHISQIKVIASYYLKIKCQGIQKILTCLLLKNIAGTASNEMHYLTYVKIFWLPYFNN